LIPKETIDEIFQQVRIEEVVGDFVHLKKAGSNYKGLSPFTDEKTPSFFVSPAKGIYKCFSTGKGGNAVNFVMEHEHFTYPEALRYIADKYNIEIVEEEKTPEQQQALNERESMLLVTGFAQQHFTHNLFDTNEGKSIGLSYFKERGYTEDTIKKFDLGYGLEKSDDFTSTAIEKGYQMSFLEKTGLTKTSNDRKFDFFRGRVMFPIHNISGKVIAFGGRTLKKDKKTAKYFNSPESDIYNKSRILYGLFQAKKDIIGKDTCYLVEGYTDVISMHQSGVENVVASSGTALTNDQIRLIKRYTEHITILYDGDNAGIKASFRGIDLILAAGMNVRVVLFPEGEDPDSFSKKVSEDELKDFIEDNAKDFLVFKTGILLSEADNDPIKKSKLIHEIVNSIALIPDPITRTFYVRECSSMFEIDEQVLIHELNKVRRKNIDEKNKRQPRESGRNSAGTPPEASTDEAAQLSKLFSKQPQLKVDEIAPQEKDIIRILLSYSSSEIELTHTNEEGQESIAKTTVAEYIVHELNTDNIGFENDKYNKIYLEFSNAISKSKILDQKHFINHPDQEITNVVANFISTRYELSEKWRTNHYIYTVTEEERLKESVQNAVYSFKLKKVKKMIDNIGDELKGNPDDFEALQTKQISLERVKQLLSKQLGRIVIK